MINSIPTKKIFNVATCHGLSNPSFHPHPHLPPSREKKLGILLFFFLVPPWERPFFFFTLPLVGEGQGEGVTVLSSSPGTAIAMEGSIFQKELCKKGTISILIGSYPSDREWIVEQFR